MDTTSITRGMYVHRAGHTFGLRIPPDILVQLKLVGARLVLGHDAAHDNDAALADLIAGGAQVLVEVGEADLGHDGRAAGGDDVVFGAEGGEETGPACGDGGLVALDEGDFQAAEFVGEGGAADAGEGGEGVGDVAFLFCGGGCSWWWCVCCIYL